jgi:hypothetical protein
MANKILKIHFDYDNELSLVINCLKKQFPPLGIMNIGGNCKLWARSLYYYKEYINRYEK